MTLNNQRYRQLPVNSISRNVQLGARLVFPYGHAGTAAIFKIVRRARASSGSSTRRVH